MRDKDPSWVIATSLTIVMLLFLSMCRGAWVEESVAINALTASGYTDPKILGRHDVVPAMVGCSDHDAVGFDVEATNSQGQRVKLLVCAGLFFKAATVRIP